MKETYRSVSFLAMSSQALPSQPLQNWISDTELSSRFPYYTRANADEVGPDPFSPLGWSLGWAKGCIPGVAAGFISFGVLEAEYSSLPDRMRHGVRSLASEIHGWVARTLRQGLDSGELAFLGDADNQAIVVGATVQGALYLARAFGPDHYHAAISQLKQLMESDR